MKVNNLSLQFTFKGSKSYKGVLALSCMVVGSKTYHYMKVSGLSEPANVADWDSKAQCFVLTAPNAETNNRVLRQLLDAVSTLAATGRYADGKALFDAYRNAESIHAAAVITFGNWVKCVADWEREKETGKSSNYQLYTTLHHKLTAADAPTLNGKRLADTPVTEITNQHFIAFGNWIATAQGGKGFRNLMTYFAAALNRAARRADLFSEGVHSLTYDWRKHKPNKPNRPAAPLTAAQRLSATANGIPTLTADEIKKVERFDVSRIAANANARNLRLLEIYKDTALLMYYLGCRPADVMQLHSVYNYEPNTNQITYTPFKKRNRGGKVVVIKLNETAEPFATFNAKALAIINKYKGQSAGGYLLPLPINETDWGNVDGSDWERWENKRKATLSSINETLKKIAKALRLSVQGGAMTAYTFRHSGITHLLNDHADCWHVAQRHGNSVNVIATNYYNPAK